MTFVPVILSGGAGTRLWPVSRELHPKPFIRLGGSHSLLQKTFLRAAALPDVAEVLTVTNRELFFKTEDEYREVNEACLATSYLLEPFGRNTAAAIAAAALDVAERHGDDATLLILAADHVIKDQAAFATAIAQARVLAGQGRLVTLGIRPDGPETGYGYIEADGSNVRRFVEKPSLERATEYCASGRHFWNAGIFCFRAGTLLSQLEMHAPDVLDAARACMAASKPLRGDRVVQRTLDAQTFEQAPNISIDYALMEKSSDVAVVPCEIGWSDVGSWSAISDMTDADGGGNKVEGEALLHDAANCYVRSEDRLVTLVGTNDLIVVDTADALLIADRSRAQEVKEIVRQLNSQGHMASKIHRKVHRPWGTYTVLEGGTRFKIKRIEVKPGASLSLQMHYHRSEHWIVVSGMAKVINGENELLVNTNESTYIPAGNRHRLENPGKLPLVMIEVQCGDYLEEDDIVRFEDSYGRA
ncbi:MAG: mannose-1-phosphate guanylyltransferase/mannose-6-phosphate isomerase [Cupriavidus sp.]|jgi:mannose-1-phosphate guanylyltransferase|uniref:mannose-1-phosphate guanylyltransferase/mannose-6-phosphate isomerase n=1 Tax=Cupriavidus pauculus TaxID=82633 RepID=UPI000C3C33C3|nr:mannose-1-phosphate guanylyltransferase/mannose-6-phosphate isomerase [Cupriavidus pauculus]KAB0604398.1 mannose-1-phosphate guanylyltransferase/mannose-6-phosphate isomerase [Cupriavidus pauculus]MBU68835.1 mannose-1-phosphate guanylyltransferase/mannose-6-phosphate isomerase [Cupriavidus sp.]MCM3606471.1 mannose-1-phosphate guanylyltransferase/mannose-6-phosphate isomerase [Cupriavidus pauculus]UAL00562.1 mannose-1-phosphate guanylyltransferase/mannose-6-phosphate isomerase [Cupriavidus pa